MGGAILFLADKLDNLAGCFGLEMIPTGTADPYALRRNALGVCRIVLEFGLKLDLRALLRQAQAGYTGVDWKLAPAEALDRLMDFFGQRLKAFWSAQGVETLVLDAAMAPGFDDISDTWQRVQALAEFSRAEDFEALALTLKRASNIIRKQGDRPLTGKVDASLLENAAERLLLETVEKVEPLWAGLAVGRDYPAMLGQLRVLRPVVDGFFDGVMVMAEDEALRANRLNLLFRVTDMVGRVADFGRLQV